MIRERLHLVDTAGTPVREAIRAAVEDAFRWVVRGFPMVDPALISNWAEEIASSMEARAADLRNPRRYAAAALNGRVRDWMRTGPAKLEPMGVGRDLERLGGTNEVLGELERKLFFEQVGTTLNDRDRIILVLVLDGSTDTEVAAALGISSVAARKAIQRMKDRIAATLKTSRNAGRGHGSPNFCEVER